MHKSIFFTIRTPEKEVFSGNVTMLKLRTEKGSLTILPNHASLLATLDISLVKVYEEGGTEHDFEVKRGILMVSKESKTIDLMVFDIFETEEFDTQSVENYLDFVEKQLKNSKDLGLFEAKFFEEEKLIIQKKLKTKKSK